MYWPLPRRRQSAHRSTLACRCRPPLLPRPGATAAIVTTPPTVADGNLRSLLEAHLVRTLKQDTRADLAAATASLLLYDSAKATNRTVSAATVGRLHGEAVLAVLSEATPWMTLPLPPPPGDHDGVSSGGGSAGGSTGGAAVDGSYQ